MDQDRESEIFSPDTSGEPNLPDELLVYMDGFRNEIEERFDKLTEKVSLLEQLFVKRVKDDIAKQKAFDELHKELQEYKRNFVAEQAKPVYKSLLLLYDTVMRQEEAGLDVALIKEELLEVLHRQNVELIREQPEKLDRKVQQAISTEETENKKEDMTIVRVVRQGFRLGEQVLRPQEVVVRKFKKTKG